MNLSQTIEDIKKAKQVIRGDSKKTNELFHKGSFIYRFSNEKISSYQSHLENKKKVLSVASSGDQILSSILFGTKEIDSFDISRFPQYYIELKKAAILSLNKQEFLNFFSPEDVLASGIFLDLKDLYSGFNRNLEKNYKMFWDEIIYEYDLFDVYTSALFEFVCHDPFELVIPYLQGKNYDLLKEKLRDVKINHNVGNIFDLALEFQDEYDLINLSNIIAYSDMNEYQKLIEKFPLTDKGIVLSYLFRLYPKFQEIYPSLDKECYTLEKKDNRSNEDMDDVYILTYKKKK